MKLKKYIRLAAALLLVSSIAVAQNDNVIDEVVWVVGDEPILRSDIEAERLSMQGSQMEGNPYCSIPEQIAIRKLYLHQAALDSIEVTESQVLQMVEDRINDLIQNYGSKEKLEEYSNRSVKDLRELFHDQFVEQMKVQTLQRNLVSDIQVTPAEVRRYFKDMPEDSLPMIPTMVEVEILAIHPRIPQSEIDRVKDELRDYTERINSGQSSFSSLAILYSEDGSSRKGGELDYTSRTGWVPEFANVAFSLTDPKKVSRIVETEYGYHIIQFIDKRGDKVKVRHILRRPKVSDEALTETTLRLDSIANDIRDNKFTFEEAVTFISDDKDTRNNYGLLQNKNTYSSKFEYKELPAEIQRQVRSMEVGEISKAFTMIDNNSKEVCCLVKLKSRVDAHRATMTDDFQALKDVVTEKRAQEKLKKWVQEKQKATYVRINEGWQDCEFEFPGWVR
jgi:peptidyl-prolyl cis-trans isomerase SurA